MEKFQLIPLTNQSSLLVRTISFIGKFPLLCPVCGHLSYIHQINKNNLRESCLCHHCGSTNRQRQMAYLLCQKTNIKSLSQVKKYSGIIYNTESFGNVHNQLVKNKNYISSEYFGEKYKSGQKVRGILHQNLMALSFPDNSLDIVLSSDVFEHISEPYKAHREIYRVLKPGGCHVFTVPFTAGQILDDKKAVISKGKIKFLQKPEYHLDGVRPKKGALVFTIFSFEMLTELAKIGFNVQMYNLNIPSQGIIGQNSLIFCATK